MKSASRVTVKIDLAANVTVIEMPEACYSSLDDGVLNHTRKLLLKLAEKAETEYLVIDLSKTDNFGARFLGLLASMSRTVKRNNKRLVISGVHPFGAELIRITRLNDMFDVYSTRASSYEAIAGDSHELFRYDLSKGPPEKSLV